MSNLPNQNPIYLDSTMPSSWRATQTLNTGTLPGTTFPAQPGIRVTKILWTGMTAQTHQIIIVEPKSGITLFNAQAGGELADQEYDYTNQAANWRDFQLTQIDSGKLYIWYR
jgi:hypothetical protein